MSLPLFIVSAIGLLIFLIAYLMIVIASFRHHPVTGLISLIPGINLVVLPSIWAQTGKAFGISFVGLMIALAGWYTGGHQFPNEYKIATETAPQDTVIHTKQPETLKASPRKIKESPLPQKPLYYLVYENAATNQLQNLTQQLLRITLTDDRIVEGKSLKANDATLLLETRQGSQIHVVEVNVQHIKTVEKLVSKQ